MDSLKFSYFYQLIRSRGIELFSLVGHNVEELYAPQNIIDHTPQCHAAAILSIIFVGSTEIRVVS